MQGYTCLRRQHDLPREFEPCIGLKLATSRHLYTFIYHKGLPFLESPQVASYFEPNLTLAVESLQKRRKKISALIQLSTHSFKHAMHIDHSFIDQPKTTHYSLGKTAISRHLKDKTKHIPKVQIAFAKCCNTIIYYANSPNNSRTLILTMGFGPSPPAKGGEVLQHD